jgi:hypothetical protein
MTLQPTTGSNQLFRCTRCETVDMIDLAHANPRNYLCTQCRTGRWHGQFPRERYNPATDDVVNPPPPRPCS